MRTLHAVVTAVAVLVAASACTTAPSPGSDPAAAALSAPSSQGQEVVRAEWGRPVAVDGYTIALDAPRDVTLEYTDGAGPLGVIVFTATLTAGGDAVDLAGVRLVAVDAGWGRPWIGQVGVGVLPAGGVRRGEVFVKPAVGLCKGLLVVRLEAGVLVEWRQESRV